MSTTPAVEVLYFGIHGRAEQIRLVLTYAQTPFVDTAVDFSDWPALKKTLPLGQLPVLRDRRSGTELVIPQSNAILRHLGRSLNLYGSDEQQHTLCDILAETIADWRNKFVPAVYGAYQPTPETTAKYWDQTVPSVLPVLEGLLANSTAPEAGLFVASQPTWADLAAFELIDAQLNFKPQLLAHFPGLAKFHATVAAIPQIATYRASRRPSEFAGRAA